MEPPNDLVLNVLRRLASEDVESTDAKTDKAHQFGQTRPGRNASYRPDHDAVAEAVAPSPFVCLGFRGVPLLLGLVSYDADHGESLLGRETRQTLLNPQNKESIVGVDRQEVVLEGFAFLLG